MRGAGRGDLQLPGVIAGAKRIQFLTNPIGPWVANRCRTIAPGAKAGTKANKARPRVANLPEPQDVVSWTSVTLPAHLSPLEQQALAAFADGVRAAFPGRVVGIELFGSRARGTGRDDSDLDVFVYLATANRADKNVIFDQAFDVSLEYGLTLSPLVGSADNWQHDMPIGRAIQRDRVQL